MNRPVLTYGEYEGLFRAQAIPIKSNIEEITVETQKERARVFIAGINICPVYPGTTTPDLTNVNVDSVKTIMAREKHNPVTSQAISCLLSKLVNSMTEEEWRRWRIRQIFGNLRKIGSDSSYGTVYETEFIGKASDSFVVKTGSRYGETDLYHEVVLAIGALNRLREFTPNFTYLYGYFSCNNPNIVPSTKLSTGYCAEGRESLYLVYEKISNAVSLGDFISDPNNSIEDIMKVIVQVLLSLQIAYEKYNFTHYDLHQNNVMVSELPREYVFTYKNSALLNKDLHIKSKYMAKIIDYGLSFATIDGVGYGRHRGRTEDEKRRGLRDIPYESKSMFAEKSFPGTDCYKLLFILGLNLWNRSVRTKDIIPSQIATDIYDALVHGPIPTRDKITMVDKYFFAMPYKPEFNLRYNYAYFVGVLSNIYGKYVRKDDVITSNIPTDGTPSWSCNSLACSNLEELLNDFVSPGSDGLNLTDFPSLLYYLDSGKDLESYVSLKEYMTSQQLLETIANNDMDNIIDILKNLSTYVKRVAKDGLTDQDLVSKEDERHQVIKIVYNLTILEEKIYAAKKLKEKHGIQDMYEEIENSNILRKLDSTKRNINRIKTQVREYIDRLADKSNINRTYSLSLLYDVVSI